MDYGCKGPVEIIIIISGPELQRAWCQDEIIGGKPQARK
jgi:hypothetical protein